MSKLNQKLENLDIETLDLFEQTSYNDFIQHMSKAEALQLIIENAEGVLSQLSENLANIAQEHEDENLY